MSSGAEKMQEINKKLSDLELAPLPKLSAKALKQRAKLPKNNKEEVETSEDEEVNSPELEINIIPEPEPELPKVVQKKQVRPRPNSDISYTAVINGVEKSYKYRTPMLRAKFIEVQRELYKKKCVEEGVQFINEMFSLIAMWQWKTETKYYIGVDEDKITEPVDLLNYYRDQPDEVKDEIFRKKPYYKNYIK